MSWLWAALLWARIVFGGPNQERCKIVVADQMAPRPPYYGGPAVPGDELTGAECKLWLW